jgi:sodium/proline symporter
MFLAVVVVPAIAFFSAGGVSGIREAMIEADISRSIIPGGALPIVGIISTMAWGLGYFGQPHILSRFMGIRSVKDLPASTAIAVVWVGFSLTFAVFIGLIGIPLFPELSGPASETVFIEMVRSVFAPWIGGVFLAAILSAIMSTIDSQLLVSSSALTEDLYKRVAGEEISQGRLVWMGRLSVVAIAVIALLLAVNPQNTVLGLVAYAWGGFGAAFGPIVIMALLSRRTTWQSALAGMLTGTIVLIVWERLGLGTVMYEIVPGFIANFLVMAIANALVRQQDEAILTGFDEVEAALQSD